MFSSALRKRDNIFSNFNNYLNNFRFKADVSPYNYVRKNVIE